MTLEEWQEHAEWVGCATGFGESRQVASASDALSGAGAPHLAGEAIDRAINLGAIYAPIPPWVGTRISLERR